MPITSVANSWLTTSRVIVAVLALAALTDLISRALPIDALAFRAWEAARYYHAPTTFFEPLKRIETEAFGDLANQGNVPEYRIYHHEVFTTDALGLRNPPELLNSGRVRAIVMGDSFAAGAGLSDDQTLAVQLDRHGVPAYSTGPLMLDPHGIRLMAARLRMTGGWVLAQHVIGVNYTYLLRAGGLAGVPKAEGPSTFADRLGRNFESGTWPLRIASDRWLRSWQDDRWFINPHKRILDIRRLANGDRMLFLPAETLEPLPQDALDAIEVAVTRYRQAVEALKSSQFRLVVVLVPDRFSTYKHLFAKEAWTGGTPPYLRRLEERLGEAGVPVVNLYPAMAQAATEEAANFHYVYWLDDTHWHPRGVRVAAKTIAAWLATHGTPEHSR